MRTIEEEPPARLRSSEATRVVEQILGFVQTKALYVAAELGVADHLVNGPRTVDELASSTGADGATLYRFLRALASVGIFSEIAPRQFALNEAADTLRSDGPISLRDLAIYYGRWSYRGWNQVMHSVRTGQAGFAREFGADVWDYHAANPEAASTFNRAMQGGAIARALALRGYAWGGDETVIDLGGGNGALLIDLLQHHTGLSGVVADLPHVAAAAEARIAEAGLTDRCSARAADLLREVPAGGDVYTLVIVLHDWDDEHAVRILQNCRRAMEPEAKLLVIEMVLADGGHHDVGKLIDLAMLVENGGRERSASEWRALLEAGGFVLGRILPGDPWSVIEALPDSRTTTWT